MTPNKEEIAERITFDKFANLGLENQVKKMIIQALTEYSTSLFTASEAIEFSHFVDDHDELTPKEALQQFIEQRGK